MKLPETVSLRRKFQGAYLKQYSIDHANNLYSKGHKDSEKQSDSAYQRTNFEFFKTKPFSVPVLCFKVY